MAAAPACILWDLVARRTGDLNALLTAFILQTLGILLPVIDNSPIMTISGAILFGGTFIGIVSLVLTMAGRYYPTRPAKMMGKMTISYGIAQIVIPAITGLLAERSGSYSDGLFLAAGIMVVGTLLIFCLRMLEINRTRSGS
jgi:cyanate permease